MNDFGIIIAISGVILAIVGVAISMMFWACSESSDLREEREKK